MTTHLPDPRFVARLVEHLRTSDRTSAFEAGGEALAAALIGGEPLPDWADDLADAMVGALLLVQDETIDHAPPEQRLKLATSAIVLSTFRPRASSATDGAVSLWAGWGMGTPRCICDPTALLQWTLLRLFLGDAEGAATSIHALLEQDPCGPGLVLHDWVVSALQGHGVRRQMMCFSHLRTSLAKGPWSPSLSVVAAVVLNQLGPMRRGEVLPWLHTQAPGLAKAG